LLRTAIPNADGQAACNELADNVPAIIEMIEGKESPEVICTQLGKCNATTNAKHSNTAQHNNMHPSSLLQSVKVESGVDGCDVCKEVVVLAEGALAQNKTEQEIEDLLHELCDCEWWSLVVLTFSHLIT
jgi:hypothetical protein